VGCPANCCSRRGLIVVFDPAALAVADIEPAPFFVR
jgi:hypothetical protein